MNSGCVENLTLFLEQELQDVVAFNPDYAQNKVSPTPHSDPGTVGSKTLECLWLHIVQ